MAKISVVGARNSGKTTLIEQLIPLLISKGMLVSTVKHTSHSHQFDTPGKDSHSHRKAGAEQTLVIGSSEIALFGTFDSGLSQELETLMERRSDICLIEGDKFSDCPKILLTRNIDQISWNEISHVVATYGLERTELTVPHFNLDELDKVVQFVTSLLSLTQEG